MKRTFLVNPKAGYGKLQQHWPTLQSQIAHKLTSAEVLFSETRDHAVMHARRALAAGCEQLVAVGGDGILNAALNALMENKENARLAAEYVALSHPYLAANFVVSNQI